MLRANNFKNSTGESQLETLAKEQALSFCPIIEKNTYTLFYKKNSLNNKLRENILNQVENILELEQMERCRGFNEQEKSDSVTPPSEKDDCQFGDDKNSNNLKVNIKDGGFFLTVKKYKINEAGCKLGNFSYAISMLSELEQFAHENMETVLKQANAYGVYYIVHQYFQSVDVPEEGDLVVYENKGSPSHAGIYRASQRNCNSPDGTVESKWLLSFTNPYVFQHDVFFIPPSFGDTARFYRSKKDASSYQTPQYNIIKTTFTYQFSTENFLMFDENQIETAIKRKKIDEMSSDEIVSTFPEIKRLNYIKPPSGVCYHYALGKILKTYGTTSIKNPMIYTSYIEENFINIVEPQSGDLVVYYTKPQHASAVHYGIYDGIDYIESKWGIGPVYRHSLFLVPEQYGNYLKFWKLKTTEKQSDESSVDLTENMKKIKIENQC